MISFGMLAMKCALDHNEHRRSQMKDKDEVVPQTTTEKPEKYQMTEAEFRRRLKNISEWRKKRLAEPHTKDTSGSLRTDPL